MAYLVGVIVFWLLATTSVSADPLTVGVTFLLGTGATSISAIGATIVGSVILGAAGFALNWAAQAISDLFTEGPKPSERQATLRQSVGPRLRFYGRVKLGGTMTFFESKAGWLYQLITLNEGEISEILQVWLNDSQVTTDVVGNVTTAQYVVNGVGVAQLRYRMGTSSQTVHTILDTSFTEITSDFRLRGTANVLARFNEVDQELISTVYPQLNPQVRLVINASLVKSVATGLQVWSDNPADCIYDYLTAKDGAGFAYGAGYAESQINLASFQSFATLSNEAVALKAGGSIKRYRLWGGYAMNEDMRSVLPRMLRTADADLYMDTSGRIAIRGGKWTVPTLTLDMDKGHIISADFRRGQSALAAFNDLSISYTEPTLDYQETEAEPWVDSANVTLRGAVLPSKLDLQMVPHVAQARRLAKIHTIKSNPAWVGVIITNFYGFNAIGEDTATIKFPLLGIDTTFLIQSVRILDDLSGVELSVTSLAASAYAWDPALEEGTAPGQPPDTSTPISLDPPANINVSVAQRTLGGGGTGAFLIVTWTEPDRTALEQEVEYRSSPGGTWIAMSVSDGVGLAESGLVSSGTTYDVRVRTRAPAGTRGPWSTIITIVANPNVSAPNPVTSLVVTPSTGQAALTWVSSNSSHSIGARVLRNTVNNSGTATLIATTVSSPSVPSGYTDTPLAAGTYYYWVAGWSGSFVASTLVASGAIVVP